MWQEFDNNIGIIGIKRKENQWELIPLVQLSQKYRVLVKEYFSAIKETIYIHYRLFISDLDLSKFLCSKSCYMSLVVRRPVFRVSDQVRHKPGCTVTEDG